MGERHYRHLEGLRYPECKHGVATNRHLLGILHMYARGGYDKAI
jgi:hypothetical protein